MKAITTGQKEQIATFVKDAARKATEEAVAELEANRTLNSDNLQRIIEKGNHVSAEVKKFLKEMFAKLAENITGCLKLISGAETLLLDPTDGTQAIGRCHALFTGYIDPDFNNWGLSLNRGSNFATEETAVQVHEMFRDGTFEEVYGGLGRHLDELCLTQDQIVQFCQKHPSWISTDGYVTFFLFKDDLNFFVASTYFASNGLRVDVSHLQRNHVWSAGVRHRFVIPQPSA